MNTRLRNVLNSESVLREYLISIEVSGVPKLDVDEEVCLLDSLKSNCSRAELYELTIRLAIETFSINRHHWSKRVASSFNEIFKKIRLYSFEARTQANIVGFCCQLCGVEELRHEFFDCCAHLPNMLLGANDQVQEAAITMTQVLCSSSLTVEAFMCSGGCVALTSLLHSPKGPILRKVLQACHALSRELNFCQEMNALGAIPILGLLLRRRDSSAVAAGVLQNVARERSSLSILDSSRIVESVSPLLFATDPLAQASAIGFFLNLHGGSSESRLALITVLKSSILEQCFDECVH
jgi:hypothetical protein